MRLSYSLRILAFLYWWYLVVFIWSILPVFGVHVGYTPPFRGEVYAWDYELFFMAVSCVWGYFLWQAAKAPQVQKLFITFTIWATTAHLAAMMVVGVVRPGDRVHLVFDAAVWLVPLLFVILGYRKEILRPSSTATLG